MRGITGKVQSQNFYRWLQTYPGFVALQVYRFGLLFALKIESMIFLFLVGMCFFFSA